MPMKLPILTSSEENYDLPSVPKPARFSAPALPGEDGAGLVPEALQVNMDLPDLRDHRELKEIKGPRDFRDLLALKALKDPRAILENLSQPLQLCYLLSPLW